MTEDGSATDPKEGGEHSRVTDRIIDLAEDAAGRIGDVGRGVAESIKAGVDSVGALLHPASAPETPRGQPVPSHIRPVRPKKDSSTWLAWRDGHWAPVHREKGVGWVWTE